jgi:transposase
MSLEIHAVVYFLWLRKLLNVAIARNIDAVYGEGVIGLRAIQKWTHRFEQGDDSLEDELRSGRPRSTKYCDAIHTLLNQNPYLV